MSSSARVSSVRRMGLSASISNAMYLSSMIRTLLSLFFVHGSNPSSLKQKSSM